MDDKQNGRDAVAMLISDIPNMLRRLRRESGLTQTEAAARAACGRPYLSLLEHGRFEPSLSKLNDLVTSYGYTLTLRLEAEGKAFEMFGLLETEVMYALERRDFERAIVLIAALIQADAAARGDGARGA